MKLGVLVDMFKDFDRDTEVVLLCGEMQVTDRIVLQPARFYGYSVENPRHLFLKPGEGVWVDQEFAIIKKE